jgi:hypothetical protein
VVTVHALVAPGVTADEHREILGSGVASAEDGAGGWHFCAGWSPAACPACSGYLRCPPRPGRGDRCRRHVKTGSGSGSLSVIELAPRCVVANFLIIYL